MRKIAEWLYQKLATLSKYAIIAFCAAELVLYARNLDGTKLGIVLKCYYTIGVLFVGLLSIRQCLIRIVSILSPFIIDGDKLLKDYELQPTFIQDGELKNLELKPKRKFGHTITLTFTTERFVQKISTSDNNLLEHLPSMGWNIAPISKAKPREPGYILALNQQHFHLSEDQTVDFFCYLIADCRQLKDADEIDDEIEKYCTGFEFARKPD